MKLERIATRLDPRVADYRDVKDPALLRERGLFMVEGRSNVRRLIDGSRYRPRSVFLSEPAHRALSDVLERLDEVTPIFVASRKVVSEVAGFDIHRGCLAACERPAPAAIASVLPRAGERSLVVVLEHLTDPDNVGAVFRNAMAFGVDAVLVSQHCCDPLYRKAIRVSMGAALCVPTARVESVPAGLRVLRDRGYRIIALHPAREAPLLVASDAVSERIALLLGTEGEGLSEEALALADAHRRIEMASGFDSLNVATASGIALHHFFQARRDRA